MPLTPLINSFRAAMKSFATQSIRVGQLRFVVTATTDFHVQPCSENSLHLLLGYQFLPVGRKEFGQ